MLAWMQSSKKKLSLLVLSLFQALNLKQPRR